MFCPHCGYYNKEGTAFCERCEKPLNVVEQPNNPQDTLINQTQPPVQHSMKWFKFLIYFALFAGAFVNAINAISMLTGSQYQGQADLVYATFDGLKTFDMTFGVLSLALAAYGIFVRFQLSGYRKNGPKLLVLLYITVCAYDLLYVVVANAILPDALIAATDFTGMYTNLAVNAIMAWANHSYLNKRKDLFVNES